MDAAEVTRRLTALIDNDDTVGRSDAQEIVVAAAADRAADEDLLDTLVRLTNEHWRSDDEDEEDFDEADLRRSLSRSLKATDVGPARVDLREALSFDLVYRSPRLSQATVAGMDQLLFGLSEDAAFKTMTWLDGIFVALNMWALVVETPTLAAMLWVADWD